MLNRDPGAPHFPTIPGHVAPSPLPALDLALTELQSRKHTWVTISVDDRIRILDRLITDYAGIMNRWVAANPDAGQMAGNRLIAVDEWENVYAVIRSLRVLRRALADVRVHGRPRIPGPVTTRPDGQVVARVFPYRWDDALILRGTTIEVWMQPDVTPANLPDSQAGAYRNKRQQGKVAVVLGAGNASSIAPLDVLNKLFVENQVVILKTNPVSSRWGPLIEEGFRALAEPGFIRVVYGGPNEGAYLCNHPGVDEIHVTGSDKTYDAIVFGGGSDASARKAAGQPMLTKPVTCELGNVSPVIVIPGPWGSADLAYAAEFLVATLTNNAGFNCDASRIIIQPKGWAQRGRLLEEVRSHLLRVPLRRAWYPGARERHQTFLAAHPEAELFGTPSDDQLPWTLIPQLDPRNTGDICFTTEAFCGLLAETALEATSVAEYLDRAVDFANEHLFGTLTVTLLVHPRSLKDPFTAAAVDGAIANLRYGTVAINEWGATSFTVGVAPWGAYPGHPVEDIQSGRGVVHNHLMFARPQKSVMRAPFRQRPKPIYFPSRARAGMGMMPKLCQLEASPSPRKLVEVMWAGLFG